MILPQPRSESDPMTRPRSTGPPTFMCVPYRENGWEDVDIGLCPWDLARVAELGDAAVRDPVRGG